MKVGDNVWYIRNTYRNFDINNIDIEIATIEKIGRKYYYVDGVHREHKKVSIEDNMSNSQNCGLQFYLSLEELNNEIYNKKINIQINSMLLKLEKSYNQLQKLDVVKKENIIQHINDINEIVEEGSKNE